MITIFWHFLGHHNKWTHSPKHINMAYQNSFYLFDISSSCWDIVWGVVSIFTRCYYNWLIINNKPNSTCTATTISLATRWESDMKEVKQVLKSHINLLYSSKKCLNNGFMKWWKWKLLIHCFLDIFNFKNPENYNDISEGKCFSILLDKSRYYLS